MAGLLGRKLGMTQVFDSEDGHVERVTVLEAGPCFVTAIRRAERDGYDAIQVGFGEVREKRLQKARLGHLKKAGVGPLGYYLPPYSYALVQVLGQAVEATKGLDQQKIADHIRATEFNTIVGKVKFGKNGEWAKGRTLMVQYQKISGNSIDQFRGPGKKVVLYPDEFKSGNLIYPYAAALK